MKFTTVIAAAAFALTAVTAHADDRIDDTPSAGAMAVDFLLVRPLGLVATVVGTALFVVQLPLDVFIKDAPAAPAQKLVVEPAKFTFTRPLGKVD